MDALDQGKIIAGRYRLERAIARGGMGSIWVGRHLQLDVPVAVKFMSPQLAASAEARARFEREAKASALLRSANAVHIYDYGVEGDAPFIVMELLDGEDLDARLQRVGRLGVAGTYAILEQAGRAIRGAHEMGLVHRDLKPANLFLARQGGGEEIVKVLDFGIAKAQGLGVGGHATKTGSLLGSPHFMSPEQVRATNKVDHRTDVWALGVIAYQCLTGRLPFSGDEIGEVLVEVCTAPIPRPSAISPDLGPEVDAFFDRALARELERRFQSVGEFLDALAALAGRASTAQGIQAPAAVEPQGAPVVMGPQAGGVHAPPAAGMGAQPYAPAPAPGTLSPLVSTQQGAAPGRGARTVIIAALAGVALALGLGSFAVLRLTGPRAAASGSAATVSAEPPQPASAAPPASASAAPPASAAPLASGEPPADSPPAATAAPAASASPTAGASAPPAKPPRPKAGSSRKADDLLNHM